MRTRIETFEIEYQNKTFPVECSFKSGIRRLNFRIRENKLYCTVPYLCTLDYVKETISKFDNRFMKRLLVEESKQNQLEEGYVYILGDKRRATYILDNPQPNDITYKSKEDLERKLKSLAVEVFTKEVRKYEQLMGINNPYKVSVRNMSTRLGSNSRKTHTLCFSLKLIHYNMDVIDSVVVHELAHHYYFDHSDSFYSIVYKYCPKYNEYRKILNKGVYQ